MFTLGSSLLTDLFGFRKALFRKIIVSKSGSLFTITHNWYLHKRSIQVITYKGLLKHMLLYDDIITCAIGNYGIEIE